jgi:LPPG:FO 2-phospho-L-lactate transferase
MNKPVLLLTGGVGGAKLALGLYRILPPSQLRVAINTGDDFEHFGLPICPDIDTTLYTLAGVANQTQGWGRAGETWHFLENLKALGGETWFQLGDKDLALHALRRQLLNAGQSLSQVTQLLAERFGVQAQLIPMSDQPVATQVVTDQGELPFQRYFVERQCQPKVERIYFKGCEAAALSPALKAAINDPALAAIIIAPSNPYLSIAPMLSLPGMEDLLRAAHAPVIAVSPIINGRAVKGPTAKIMAELGLQPSAAAVANRYASLLDGYILDSTDAALCPTLAMPTRATNTLMNSLHDREQLARDCLDFALELAP